MIEKIIFAIEGFIWSPYFLMPLLFISALYFTIRTKFVQFRMFGESIRVMTTKKEKTGGVSSTEAFLIGLASRVGSGNIIGVSLAILLGGPGAVFWMWFAALFVGVSSLVENTLGQLFKDKDPVKGYTGGAATYMSKGFKNKKIGRMLAVTFALIMPLVYGVCYGGIQANNFTQAFTNIFDAHDQIMFSVAIGFAFAILVSYALFSGSKKIVKISSILVPIKTVGFLVLGLLVIVLNFQRIPEVFGLIFTQAFAVKSVVGGGIGVAIIQGAKKGMFANEAGMGSAPNASATATVDHPLNQGLVQMLGVYIDTFLICTTTALIVLLGTPLAELSKMAQSGSADGTFVMQNALNNSLGNWSSILLTVFLFAFSFTAIIGNYYYAESSLEFLTRSNKVRTSLKVFIVLFVFASALISPKLVWSIGEIGMGVLATLNIIATLVLFNYVVKVIKDYQRQKKEGKNPVFNQKDIGMTGTVWDDNRAAYEKEM